jgi:hypothetical protein
MQLKMGRPRKNQKKEIQTSQVNTITEEIDRGGTENQVPTR